MDVLSTKPTFLEIFTHVFMKLEDLVRDPTMDPEYGFQLRDVDKATTTFEIGLIREVHPVPVTQIPEDMRYSIDEALPKMQAILGENWKYVNQPTAGYLDAENLKLLLQTFENIAGTPLSLFSTPGHLVIGFERCRVLFIRHDLQ